MKATETDILMLTRSNRKGVKRLQFTYYGMKCQLQTIEGAPKRRFLAVVTYWGKKTQARWKRGASQLWEEP